MTSIEEPQSAESDIIFTIFTIFTVLELYATVKTHATTNELIDVSRAADQALQEDTRDDPRRRAGPAEEALMARITRYFEEAIRSLPKRDKAKVLAARNDFWTVMETLVLAPVRESPELGVRLRGAMSRRALLEEEGGVISPSSVARLFHISRQAVGQRRAASKLLGVETPTGFMYPVWQFDDSGTLAGLEEALKTLADYDQWTQLVFFLTENDALNGRRPLDVMRGGKVTQMLRAARLHGVHAAV